MSNVSKPKSWSFSGDNSDEAKFIDQIGSFSETTPNDKIKLLRAYIRSVNLRTDLSDETIGKLQRTAHQKLELEQISRGLI